jgi:hypothetical protein
MLIADPRAGIGAARNAERADHGVVEALAAAEIVAADHDMREHLLSTMS